MVKWLQSHRGRSFVAGTVAVVTLAGLGYVVGGPLDAFGSTTSATVTPPAAVVSTMAKTGTPTNRTGTAPTSSSDLLVKSNALGRAHLRAMLKVLLRRSVHASFVMKDASGAYVTVDFDRGTVESVSSTSITILRKDGVSVTTGLTTTTQFVRTTEATLAVGAKVGLVEVGADARYVIEGGKGARKAVSQGAVAPPTAA